MNTLGAMTLPPYEWTARSDAGPRDVNEDRVFADPSAGLFLVCDGRGGPGLGDRASALVQDALANHADPMAALQVANERLYALGRDPALKGIGATLALVRIEGDGLDLYGIGEVRAYLARDGELTQLTQDHTLAAQLVRTQQISADEAKRHPARKSLLRYLGKDPVAKIDALRVPLQPGDSLLLCSDGFYSQIPPTSLLELASVTDWAPELERLMAQAKSAGAEDNLSALVIRYDPSARTSALDLHASFTEQLALALDPDRLVRVVLDRMVALSTADRGVIALLDDDGQPFSLQTTSGETSPSDLVPSRALISKLLERKRSEWIEAPQTAAAIPLKVGTEVIGLIYLERLAPSPDFTKQALGFLEGLASHAALAIHHLRANTETNVRMQKLQLINEVSLAMNATLELDELLSLILMHSLALTGGDQGYLLLGEGADLTCLASRDLAGQAIDQLEISRSIVSRCIEQERAICILDTHEDEESQTRSVMALDLRSVICVPLVANQTRVGLLYISSRAISKTFTLKDQSLLEAIANQAAMTIRNAQLLKEQERQIVELNRTLELVKEAQAKAVTDGLTGLYNHVYFKEQLYNSVLEADRYGHPLSVVFVDLDHFKRINDTYGHQTGDEVLRAASGALRKLLRDCDVLARYGGEELAILLPQTDQPGAVVVAGRVRTTLEGLEVESVDGQPVRFTASLGVAAHRPGLTMVELVERADKALYAAKRAGRNQVQADGLATTAASPARQSFEVQQQTFLSTVAALSEAVNLRDRYTADHARLVETLARRLGVAMGLEGRRLKEVELAAVLHDVGKLGIPDALLQKPGPLDDHEWEMMRTHPVQGARILKAGNLPNIAQIIACHHERWDGTGYPEGLSGEAIPLAARLVAVLDAYGAMVTDRPHRAAMPHAEALAEIARAAGTQFDPAVVRAFLEIIDSLAAEDA